MKLGKIINGLKDRPANWHGSAREAYYDKRSNLVFKRVKDCSKYDSIHYHWSLAQHQKEIELFQRMTEAEKEIFPIIAIYTDKKGPKKEIWIVMKRAKHFKDYMWPDPSDEDFLDWTEEHGFTNGREFLAFIRKHQLKDVYCDNIGYIGHRLVVVDSGI